MVSVHNSHSLTPLIWSYLIVWYLETMMYWRLTTCLHHTKTALNSSFCAVVGSSAGIWSTSEIEWVSINFQCLIATHPVWGSVTVYNDFDLYYWFIMSLKESFSGYLKKCFDAWVYLYSTGLFFFFNTFNCLCIAWQTWHEYNFLWYLYFCKNWMCPCLGA